MKNKLLGCIIGSLLMIATTSPVLANVKVKTVSGFKCINNYADKMDYKISNKDFNGLKKNVCPSVDYIEDFFYSDNQYLKGFSKELSYLISHNIISRDIDLSNSSEGFNLDYSAYGNSIIEEDVYPVNIKRSDFMMALDKAVFGVKKSRPLVLESNSYRKINGKDIQLSETNEYKPKIGDNDFSNQTLDYSRGDSSVYITPNVYELYFSELLDKGILKIDDFKDIKFRQEYVNNGKTVDGKRQCAEWNNSLGNYNPWNPIINSNNISSFDSEPFGQSFKISNYKWQGSLDNFYMQKVEPNYFVDENITVMQALHYVESVMKLSEKNMTNLESQIITFKYGADFISNLPEKDKNTIMFLVAKGILNFEDRAEFGQLYGPLTNQFMYKILYRLNNDKARFDFSKLQLTDNDNYWLKEGLYQRIVKIKTGMENPPVVLTKVTEHTGTGEDNIVQDDGVDVDIPSRLENKPKSISFLDSAKLLVNKIFAQFIKPIKPKYNDSPMGSSFTIERVFSAVNENNKYYYRGLEINNLAKGDCSKQTNGEITKIEEKKSNIKETAGFKNDGKVYKVTFSIKADTSKEALAYIDANTDCVCEGMIVSASVDAVTTIKTGGGKQETFVSASDLKKFDSELRVIDDKHLMNIRTGAEALMLSDNKRALIGNEIIKTDKTIVFGLNHEVYYNLDILCRLMSNCYLSKINPDSFYVSTGMKSEGVVHVMNESCGRTEENAEDSKNYIDRTLVADFPNMHSYKRDDNNKGKDIRDTVKMFNLTQLTRGVTALISDISFNDKKGHYKYALMVTEWKYILPDGIMSKEFDKSIENPSIRQMSEFLFTRPSDKELQEWWDGNLGLSNALCNFMYGTKGVQYVKSGYLAPNVSILVDSDITEEDKELMLGDVQFDSKYMDRFCSSKWWVDLFPTSTVGSSVYDKLSTSRVFSIIKGKKDMTNGFTNYTDYVTTPGRAVYERLGHTYPSRYDNDKNVLYLKMRSAKNSSDKYERPRQFEEYRIKCKGGEEHTFYYDSLTSLYGKLYYRMVLKDCPKVFETDDDEKHAYNQLKDKTSGNFKLWHGREGGSDDSKGVLGLAQFKPGGSLTFKYVPKDGASRSWRCKPLSDYLMEYIVPSDKESDNWEGNDEGKEPKAYAIPNEDDDARGLPIATLNKNPGLLYAQGNLYDIDDGTEKFPEKVKIDSKYNSIATAHPVIYLRVMKWGAKDGKLCKLDKNNYMNMLTAQTNVLGSGINSAMIDSILAKSYKLKTTRELPDGARVIIGDTAFKANQGYLNSYPIGGDIVSKVAQTGVDSKSKLSAVLASYFSGQNMALLDGTIMKVDQANLYYPLESYITDIGIGELPSDCSPKGTYQCSNGQYSIVGSDTERFSSICMKVRFNNAVRYKLIDSTTNTYSIVYTTDVGADGYLDDLPFYSETMGLSFFDDIFAKSVRIDFKKLDNAESLMSNFRDAYQKDFETDLIHLIKNLILSIIGYFLVMSTIVFMIQHGHILDSVLYRLKYPDLRKVTRGIDLIKVFTLGVFDLETKIDVKVLIIGQLVGAVIFGCILKWLN